MSVCLRNQTSWAATSSRPETMPLRETFTPSDVVVISIGFRPVKSMAEEILALGYEVIEIGDGEKVGNVMTSIWSAFDAAKEI